MTAANSCPWLTNSESKLCYDWLSVSKSVLMSSPIRDLRPDFCYCQFQVYWCGAPSLTKGQVCRLNCCWFSPTQSYLLCINSSDHFASGVLIQFLWWPLFCLLLSRPHWALSWSAEIPLRLLWTYVQRRTVCIRSLNWLGTCCWLCLKGGGTHFSHCVGAGLCSWVWLRLLLLLCVAA
jgi:hypothetical protein